MDSRTCDWKFVPPLLLKVVLSDLLCISPIISLSSWHECASPLRYRVLCVLCGVIHQVHDRGGFFPDFKSSLPGLDFLLLFVLILDQQVSRLKYSARLNYKETWVGSGFLWKSAKGKLFSTNMNNYKIKLLDFKMNHYPWVHFRNLYDTK